MAVRVVRDWTTMMMLGGSVMASLGLSVFGAGAFLMQRDMTTVVGSGFSGFDPERYQTIMMIGVWMLGLGLLAFVGAFVGFVGRFGAVHRRAAEVEGMVQGVQERMEEMR